MVELTQENYYQDTSRLSYSRYKRYKQCQAKAYAVDNGIWVEERDETPLLLGNYVHSYFESPEAHEKFMAENGNKLLAKTGKNKGNLKSDFIIGDKMIESLKDDDGFNRLYHGYSSDKVEKEMIVCGEIEGVPVKGKLDSVNLSRGYFVDLKTMKSIYSEEWNAELRKRVPAAVNNILNFGYHGQLGLYRELLKQMTDKEFRPLIVAVSKENVPDKDILKIDEEWLEDGLDNLKADIVEIWNVIQGKQKPQKCGHCDYCRNEKKLDAVISLNDLIGEI
ncbi:PD-(D/E)XK nuclease-like domain-containing protein [Streptococcus anginosus]|uniref:PD-(D/E)XK nuclease-like domain-containing protein n=1 Tax=Streptococcus anginosus TaxID=1328 RepID=UPI0021F8B584|nr:PD-(D/E)XK nuclease-like domain-containing protein [Streptococcus anginosus]MCW1057637.1 PD-(D/E)XK nuclease-like domain-containing protein [Streptococcus anginosus]MED5837037.1 PD-(D/E)XK nuclease-like domain-containing protein [Streptococcus anginosus]MED5848317.1 PD-(D/E)XK nuclease-like domain-containing protein [Streptococcus anginosus]MED5857956.1 PD-(D/E)XK nuclease-like domain-containing protein [Streptococcus anginosus]MED5875500.1 PD-(D/E)XK nuclease-like domain-containing protein